MDISESAAEFLYVPTVTAAGPDLFPAGEGLYGALVDAAKEPENVDLLIQYIKVLARFCSTQNRWATTQLVANCNLLVKLVISDSKSGKSSNAELEKVAESLRGAFKVTLLDNEHEEQLNGRTRECYALAVCLLAVYVRMRAYALAEGILHATTQYKDNIAPLALSEPQVQAKFLFYKGCLHFFKLEYSAASADFEQCLLAVKYKVPKPAFEQIMAFYIPSQYCSKRQLPSNQLWKAVPRLETLYKPLLDACRAGNWGLFTTELESRRAILVRNRLLLSFEYMARLQKVNLLVKIWKILEKPKRIDLNDYATALQCSKSIPTNAPAVEAAEFYIAQMIANGDVKGYIHNEYKLLLLSKTDPFPKVVKKLD